MRCPLLLFLLAFPAIILTFSRNDQDRMMVMAEDDIDDEMVDVEGEETAVVGEDAPEEDEAPDKPTGSPDADSVILFTKPAIVPGSILELPGGVPVEFLVGFKNKGSGEFVLETLDASFRYPMDFNFYIQNFSTLAYERAVPPGQEASLFYSFIPAEAFAGRPFGLSVNLRYRDLNGNQFYEGVYNETVNIIELDEGLDGETFFLYVFLGALGVLALVVGQQFLYSVGRKRGATSSGSGSHGGKKHARDLNKANANNNAHNNVDYDWIPSQVYNEYVDPKSSPKASKSPKASPRQRKAKRGVGDD